jgi:hypothetical protein
MGEGTSNESFEYNMDSNQRQTLLYQTDIE